MDYYDFFKNTDNQKIQDGIKKAQDFLSTKEGRQFAEYLSGGDLSNITSKLKNPNNLSAADRDNIIKTISQNPEILKKIESLLKG